MRIPTVYRPSLAAAAALVVALGITATPTPAQAEPPPAATQPAAPVKEPSTGTLFAREIALDGTTYQLRGIALRRVHILFISIDVYAIGYYTAAQDERLKAFRLVAAREMSRSRIVTALSDAFQKQLGAVPGAARPILDAVVDSPKGESTYYYAAKADELTVRQGARAPVTVRDAAVTSAVFGQWISPRYAVTPEIQRSLTGGR